MFHRFFKPCDYCADIYQRESLHPVSGDWHVCDECLKKILKG